MNNIAELIRRLYACLLWNFDMDGTLILSELINQAVSVLITNQYMMKNRGLAYDSPYLIKKWHQGKGVVEEVIRLCGELELRPLSEHEQMLLLQATEDAIELALREKGVAAAPGVSQCLALGLELRRIIKVASSSGLGRVDAGLDRSGLAHFFPHEHRFSALRRSDGTYRPKPDSWVYDLAAEGHDPQDCAAFEDSGGGVKSAKLANYGLVIGYTGGTPEPDRPAQEEVLWQAGADFVIPDWSLLLPNGVATA
jgi:beta-phosphoglucomutase-like phosphatase (HAD superfamily)